VTVPYHNILHLIHNVNCSSRYNDYISKSLSVTVLTRTVKLQSETGHHKVLSARVTSNDGTSTGKVWLPQHFQLVQLVSAPVVSRAADSVQSVHSVTVRLVWVLVCYHTHYHTVGNESIHRLFQTKIILNIKHKIQRSKLQQNKFKNLLMRDSISALVTVVRFPAWAIPCTSLTMFFQNSSALHTHTINVFFHFLLEVVPLQTRFFYPVN